MGVLGTVRTPEHPSVAEIRAVTPSCSTDAMRYTEIDRRIDALAATQFGAFSRQQAFDLGASERMVKRRLAERHWTRPVAAVYVLTRSAGTWNRQCKIAELG